MTSLANQHSESTAAIFGAAKEGTTYIRIQLPNSNTTVMPFQHDMTMWEAMNIICAKKELSPSQHAMKVGLNDGTEVPVDDVRTIDSYDGIERLIVETISGQKAPPLKSAAKPVRRPSVMNAPASKSMSVRVASVEFPTTLTDQADISKRMNQMNKQSDYILKGKTQKSMKSLSMFLFKKGGEEGDFSGSAASLGPSELATSTSSLLSNPHDVPAPTDDNQKRKQSVEVSTPTVTIVKDALAPFSSVDAGISPISEMGTSFASSPGIMDESRTGSFSFIESSADVDESMSLSSVNDVSLRLSTSTVNTVADQNQSLHKASSAEALTKPLTAMQVNEKKIRKRTISTPATGLSSSTLKRTNFRRPRSEIDEKLLSRLELDTAGNSLQQLAENFTKATIRVQLPDNWQKLTVTLPSEITMESVLMHICQKTNHDFDKHSLEFTDKSIVLELDKTWDHYVKEHKVTEVVLVNNGAKAYSTMCVSQGDTDVMLLRLIDGRMQVMAGTPEMLIERLTDENEKDMSYHDILILTFRSFMNPAEFFDCLLARFFCELPQNPSPEDVEYFTKMKVPTQKRVLKTLMWWTEHHWHDFGLNTELRLDLAEFSTSLETAEKGTFLTESRELKFIINQQNQAYEDMVGYYKSVERKGKTMESMLQEITPEDLAQQLCLHDFRLFKYIHPIEVLNQIWKKEADGGSPSLEFFIERFDKESYWVATEIVNVKDFKKRVNALKTFVLAAKACQEMHNFYSMFALIAGLNLTPVQRLKKTWEALPPPAKKAFQDLEKIADPSRNMKNYRDQLTECKPPIVPFLPIYMKDLTFMNDGNESKVRGMINFDKLRMMANRVKDISALAAKEYKFEPNPAVLNYLAKPPIEKSMSKLKALSAECEK